MPKGFTEQDAALLDALGVETEPKKVSPNTVREERIIAGFEEIQRFADQHGRAPNRDGSRDVFERLYAVRLDRMSRMEECRKLLAPLDRQGLLRESDGTENGVLDAADDEALLAELGVEAAPTEISELRHVRSSAEKRASEEIASRTPCEDFERFRPLFDHAQREIDEGVRETRPFERKAEIEAGRFFVVGGQKAYVAAMGPVFTQEYGDKDARLRVIFDNGTESTSSGVPSSGRSTRTRRAAGSPNRRLARYSPVTPQTATRRAARSTSCGASPIFLASRNIAN